MLREFNRLMAGVQLTVRELAILLDLPTSIIPEKEGLCEFDTERGRQLAITFLSNLLNQKRLSMDHLYIIYGQYVESINKSHFRARL